MLHKKIERKIKSILKNNFPNGYKFLSNELKVFACDNINLCDYSTNLYFLISKIFKDKANNVWSLLRNQLEKYSYIQEINLDSGYINFFINKKYFFDNFKEILIDKHKLANKNKGLNKKVIIEYVSANPTGPLHLGNSRGAVIGDFLAKAYKFFGYKVIKEYYVNDRGKQIDLLAKTFLYYLGKESDSEELYKGNYIKEICDRFKDQLEKLNFEQIKEFAYKYILNNMIKKTLVKFGTIFDNFYFESDLYKKNLDKKIFNFLKDKDFLYSKDGAIWLNLKKFGEEKDEVLIKSDGEPTYFFSDIIYNYEKFFIRKYDYSIIIVASDHHDHIRRLQNTFENIFHISKNKFKFIEYQMVHIFSNSEKIKMSKRAGNYVELETMINEVGVQPIRFYFAKYSPEVTINFDVDLAKKENIKNQIWYILYTYARFNSILDKARKLNFKIDFKRNIKTNIGKAFIYLINKEEYLKIFRFTNQITYRLEESLLNLKTNLFVNYLLKLCDLLNSFYEKEKIIEGESKEIRFKILFVLYIVKLLDFMLAFLNIKPNKRLYKVINENSN
jgi:arginyl-tRNA synthetase